MNITSKKSQISVEYMFIIGFATLITIPLLMIYHYYTSDSRDSVQTSQALQVARNIVDSAESVYYLGDPSQTTIKANFPGGIQSTNLSNNEVHLKIKVKNGITDIVQVSSVNMSGNLPLTQGIHTLTIRAQDGRVQISSD